MEHVLEDGRRVIPFSAEIAQCRGTRGYVENVAHAIVCAATDERARGRIYNVGERDALSELEWARLIGDAAGWDGDFRVLPADQAPAHLRPPGNAAQHWIADTTRIRLELRYDEPVTRVDAIRRTVTWERANPPAVSLHEFDYAAEDAAISA